MRTGVTIELGSELAVVARMLRLARLLGGGPDANGGAKADREANVSGTGHPGPSPDFEQAVESLFRTLSERGVRYLLVGGVAMVRYVPGRNTEDIDLLLALEELYRLPELRVLERTDWFARGDYQGIQVDCLFTANPLFRHVLESRATAHAFRELNVPCATAEGLVLLKLFALPSLYRQGQIQRANLYESDLAALILGTGIRPEPLLEQLSSHLPASDIKELRGILSEIERRRDRFRE